MTHASKESTTYNIYNYIHMYINLPHIHHMLHLDLCLHRVCRGLVYASMTVDARQSVPHAKTIAVRIPSLCLPVHAHEVPSAFITDIEASRSLL